MSEESSVKVGVLGGTFNPPHVAHLIAAETVRDHLKLNKIIFIPAATPPHKLNVEIIPAEQRLQMVKLAIRSNPSFELSDVELKRNGPSYTVDTLVDLKNKFPKDDLYFLTGIDLLLEFHTWKSPDRILEICTLVAMNRPGFDLAKIDKDLLRKVELISVPALDISSTFIRRQVKAGKSIKYLVPFEVEKYIRESSIYV
jgi:nicotinate-nucleotide adenylyltransferase